MGLIDQLWDDTVAGPRPDHGLGRLRKYSSFSPSSSAAPAADAQPTVTRSITIARPQCLSAPSGESTSLPSTPASAPDSPFAAAVIYRDRFSCTIICDASIHGSSMKMGKKNMNFCLLNHGLLLELDPATESDLCPILLQTQSSI
ncbi:hypothetical protein ACQJBY_062425 [Aegilops geniculata]